MEAYLTTFQKLLMSAAAFLTMLGCGLGDTLMEMVDPGFSVESETMQIVPVDPGNPESVAMQFIDGVAAGDYIGASTHLCAEAIPGFFELDPTDNVLLGADTSGLIPVVEVDGLTARLNFDGDIILDPGTADEFPIPGDLIPFSDVEMIDLNGVWLLCPAALIE